MPATEVVTIFSAKKSHECSWCSQAIKKGDTYKRYRWFDGCDASTVKMHPECLDASYKLISELNESIEFFPGDYPRGCYCDFDPECDTCNQIKQRLDKENPVDQEG